ncbi:MAG: S1 RNA-binding domain-containing protein [Saprospiraceae bacterium]
MLKLGEYNTLKVFRQTDNGIYLQDDEGHEVLLPNKFVPEELEQDQEMKVFLFTDGEDRYTATTQEPKILANQFGYLEVVDVNDYGAFLDMGLEKHLLVPFSQQNNRMYVGESYLVCMYVDEVTDRLVGSSKIIKLFADKEITLQRGEEVDLLIGPETDLGYKVIVNQTWPGLIYHNEIFKPVQSGDKTKGYVKLVRDDDKIDIRLQKIGYDSIPEQAKTIINALQENEGFLPLTDKSSPDEISIRLHMSKKVFKKSIGGLYKARMIRIEKDGIHLIEE